MVLTVYHDLNVCYYGRPMLNNKIKKLGQNKFNHIKLRLLQFLQMLLILIMNKNVPLHLTQATIKCAFLRDKKK